MVTDRLTLTLLAVRPDGASALVLGLEGQALPAPKFADERFTFDRPPVAAAMIRP